MSSTFKFKKSPYFNYSVCIPFKKLRLIDIFSRFFIWANAFHISGPSLFDN